MNPKVTDPLKKALALLNLHHQNFYSAAHFARETDHPVPSDTRGWSQILVSVLTGLKGLKREKGPDLVDGSDVKGANTWEAIDTPRFNGVIKAGTKAVTAGKLESLDKMPYLFLVLWDHTPSDEHLRCRIWCVRPQQDRIFRAMCKKWYGEVAAGKIISTNFQLHPPRGKNSNEIRNTCGNLLYPLLLCAEYINDGYKCIEHKPEVMKTGKCEIAPNRNPL